MPCLVPTYNFEMYQGDTYNLIFTMTGDQTAKTAKLQLRSTIGASTPTISLITGSGITMTYDSVTGLTTVICTFTATQTGALSPTTIYFYDFELTQGATVKTYFQGNINVTAEKSKV